MNTKSPEWTEVELAYLRGLYADSSVFRVDLDAAARYLGRQKTNVCRKARALGLTNPRRRKGTRIPLKLMAYGTDAEHRAAVSERIKSHIAEKGHPRGFLGGKHGDEALEKISQKAKAAWRDPNSGHNSPERREKLAAAMRARIKAGVYTAKNAFSRCRRGYRDDIGITVRSSWEANYPGF